MSDYANEPICANVQGQPPVRKSSCSAPIGKTIDKTIEKTIDKTTVGGGTGQLLRSTFLLFSFYISIMKYEIMETDTLLCLAVVLFTNSINNNVHCSPLPENQPHCPPAHLHKNAICKFLARFSHSALA